MAKKITTIDLKVTYRFCGNGQGIFGLPHEVTGAQAVDLGQLEVLQAAVNNGNYKIVTKPAGSADKGE